MADMHAGVVVALLNIELYVSVIKEQFDVTTPDANLHLPPKSRRFSTHF